MIHTLRDVPGCLFVACRTSSATPGPPTFSSRSGCRRSRDGDSPSPR
jgi:hypothetical protein